MYLDHVATEKWRQKIFCFSELLLKRTMILLTFDKRKLNDPKFQIYFAGSATVIKQSTNIVKSFPGSNELF